MRVSVLTSALLVFAVAFPVLAQDEEEPIAEAVATAEATADSTEGSTEAAATQSVRPLAATLMLTNGTTLAGTLLETTELPMKTSFGEATIPLSEVAGIKLAREGIATTTIVLHNGDSITGAVELERVLLETVWGKADVNGSSVSSLLFAPGLKWISENGVSGTRWSLTETEQAQASTQPEAAASASNANSNRETYIGRDGRRYYRSR